MRHLKQSTKMATGHAPLGRPASGPLAAPDLQEKLQTLAPFPVAGVGNVFCRPIKNSSAIDILLINDTVYPRSRPLAYTNLEVEVDDLSDATAAPLKVARVTLRGDDSIPADRMAEALEYLRFRFAETAHAEWEREKKNREEGDEDDEYFEELPWDGRGTPITLKHRRFTFTNVEFYEDHITCNIETTGNSRNLIWGGRSFKSFICENSRLELHDPLIALHYSYEEGTLQGNGFFLMDDNGVSAADLANARQKCKRKRRNIAHAGVQWWSRIIQALDDLYGTDEGPHIKKHTLTDAWQGWDKTRHAEILSEDLMRDNMKEACRSRLGRMYSKKELKHPWVATMLDKGAEGMVKNGFYGAFGYTRTPDTSLMVWNAGDPRRDFRVAFCDA